MKVQISVRGRRYTVRSDEDVDLVAIARYVDGKMTEIASRPGALDEYTIAMLACMNIASDYERFRKHVEGELAEIDRDIASTAVLAETGSGGVPEDDLAEETP